VERIMIVTGLVMTMAVDGRAGSELGGPLVAASVGARLRGAREVRLVGAVSHELGQAERELLAGIDPTVGTPEGLLTTLPLPPLRWVGPAVVGDAVSAARIEGNPSLWTAACPASSLDGETVALANSDPRWMARLLEPASPARVLVALHGDWIPYRGREIEACLEAADVVCLTRRDLGLLSPAAARRLESITVVITDGSRGVEVVSGPRRDRLPPPTLSGARVTTDVGAGDLMFGCLAGWIDARAAGERGVGHDRVCQAYEASSDLVGSLLSSHSFAHFLARARSDGAAGAALRTVAIREPECVRCGACTTIAPAIFAMDTTAAIVARQPERDAEIRDCDAAILNCPANAIHWVEVQGNV
jgi:ferredoxin